MNTEFVWPSACARAENEHLEASLKIQKDLHESAKNYGTRITAENESLWETFVKVADFLGIDNERARSIPGKPSQVFCAAILRKQAEAVDAAIEWVHNEYPHLDGPHLGLIITRAQRLRQQADENQHDQVG